MYIDNELLVARQDLACRAQTVLGHYHAGRHILVQPGLQVLLAAENVFMPERTSLDQHCKLPYGLVYTISAEEKATMTHTFYAMLLANATAGNCCTLFSSWRLQICKPVFLYNAACSE